MSLADMLVRAADMLAGQSRHIGADMLVRAADMFGRAGATHRRVDAGLGPLPVVPRAAPV